MKTLNISDQLSLPSDVVTQTIVVYGGKGMGKTNFLVVVAEELAATAQRFSIIDPVGVFWGLRHSEDGKGRGVEVLILGGRHGDLPIEPTGGGVVADLVVDEEVNVIIDISCRADGKTWGRGERIRFVTDYFIRLYERQGERRRPILQILDEASRFVPQIMQRGDEQIAKCLGAIEQVVEEGRNYGIGIMLAAQRSARLNKSVAELAECMIAFRTIGPNSVDAITDWLGEHVEKTRWKEASGQIRELERGSALVVSPGWLHKEGVVHIRKRDTFDTSATPVAGKERKAHGQGAKPDLSRYATRMAETIERAKADDPRELRKEIAALRKELLTKPGPPTVTKTNAGDVEKAFERGARSVKAELGKQLRSYVKACDARVQSIFTGLQESSHRLSEAVDQVLAREMPPSPELDSIIAAAKDNPQPDYRALAEVNREINRTAQRPPTPSQAPREAASSNGHVDLDRLRRSILTSLAQHPDGLRKNQILTHAGYAAGGKVSSAFAELLRNGYIIGSGTLYITEGGKSALGPYDPLPTGKALRAFLLNGGKLNTLEKALLRVVCEEDGFPIRKTDILERAKYAPGGKVSSAFAKLVRLGYVRGTGAGSLSMSDQLKD